MSGSPWKSVRRVLPGALVVLVFCVCELTQGTAAPPTSRVLTVPPSPQRMPLSPTPAAAPGASRFCECESNFWIVSSRRCQQKGSKGCVGCRLDHFHSTGDGCELQRDARAFQRWLQPGVPICVIVHGSFVSFEGLMTETRQMARWIRSANPGQPLQIVYFTWPSDGPFTGLFQIDIGSLGRRSAFNGIYLAQFISMFPENSSISLIGHSHGARAVSAALHLLGGGIVQNFRLCKPAQCKRKLRVVFLAAAIDHHWLNPDERYGRAFCPVEALLNVRNERDLPLLFYPLRRPFAHRALARTGFTKTDRRLLGPSLAKVKEIDVTPLVGRRHFWQFYFEQPRIAKSIAPYIFFTDRQQAVVPVPMPVSRSMPVKKTPVQTVTIRKQATTAGWRRTRSTIRTSNR